MNWKASPSAVEIAVASIAASCLGSAVGFAVARMAPLGAGLVESSVAGALVALAGGLLIGRIDRQRGSRRPFAAVESLSDLLAADDVLLLDQRVDGEVLLLDDALRVDGESRVVRLFAAPSGGIEAAPPFAAPGEMSARIEDVLGHARGDAAAEPKLSADEAAPNDASAALHAALADIRRSLRQG